MSWDLSASDPFNFIYQRPANSDAEVHGAATYGLSSGYEPEDNVDSSAVYHLPPQTQYSIESSLPHPQVCHSIVYGKFTHISVESFEITDFHTAFRDIDGAVADFQLSLCSDPAFLAAVEANVSKLQWKTIKHMSSGVWVSHVRESWMSKILLPEALLARIEREASHMLVGYNMTFHTQIVERVGVLFIAAFLSLV